MSKALKGIVIAERIVFAAFLILNLAILFLDRRPPKENPQCQ
jgi:hypothetical protein